MVDQNPRHCFYWSCYNFFMILKRLGLILALYIVSFGLILLAFIIPEPSGMSMNIVSQTWSAFFIQVFVGGWIPFLFGFIPAVLWARSLGRASLKKQRTYLSLSFIGLAIMALLYSIAEPASHIDCGNQCQPYLPGGLSMAAVTIVAIGYWLIIILLSYLWMRRMDKSLV